MLKLKNLDKILKLNHSAKNKNIKNDPGKSIQFPEDLFNSSDR